MVKCLLDRAGCSFGTLAAWFTDLVHLGLDEVSRDPIVADKQLFAPPVRANIQMIKTKTTNL